EEKVRMRAPTVAPVTVLIESSRSARNLIWQNSQVTQFSHSLAKAIVKCLDVDLELLFNYTSCLRLIVFSIVPRPRVRAGVRKHFSYSKLFRDHRPVFLQALESANKVRQHPAIGVDKPIKLVAMRR